MRISKKARYGLRAMAELACYYKDGPISAKAVSRFQSIPLNYLEQIFNQLKRAGLIKTTRGPKGGYFLSRPPSKIKVGQIIEPLEANGCLVECLEKAKKPSCSRIDTCATRRFWKRLNGLVKGAMDTTTLKQLCPERPKRPKGSPGHSYHFQI